MSILLRDINAVLIWSPLFQENYFRVYSESEYNRLNSVARLNLKPVHIKPGEAMFGYPNMI